MSRRLSKLLNSEFIMSETGLASKTEINLFNPSSKRSTVALGTEHHNIVSRSALAIRVHNVTVAYNGRPVLRSVSFDVLSGQMVGIIGPNGAGKSTLMKAILGLQATDNGTVAVFNESIARCRSRVAYVPQIEDVDWDFPVRVLDVIMMGRSRRLQWGLWPGRHDRRLALEALHLVGMSHFVDRHIRQLSGGQQQRVFIARALCQQADILLLDEPIAGVDAATKHSIFELIQGLTAQNRTILVVNHDLKILKRFDKLLLLNQRVIAYGPPHDVATDENLRRTYGGRLNLLERAEESLRGGQ